MNEYRLCTVDIQSQDIWAKNQTFERLSNTQWRQVYDTMYLTEHSDLVLVIDRLAYNATQSSTFPLSRLPFIAFENEYYRDRFPELTSESWEWLRYDRFIYHATPSWGANEHVPGTNITWGINSWPVSARVAHAFSLKVPPNSSLRLSLVYMIIVIIFNVLKLLIMVWTLVFDRSMYLVTVGDATASFLQRPDPTTTNICVLGKDEVLHKLISSSYHARTAENRGSFMFRVRGMWLPQQRRQFSAVSRDRQAFYICM